MAADDTDSEDMEALRVYRRDHSRVIITDPSETPSGLWEVSLPSSSTIAFDSLPGMLRALWLTTVPDDGEASDR